MLDTDRQRSALTALDLAAVHLKAGRAQQAAIAEELAKTLSRPDVTDEELAAVFARVDRLETESFNALVEVRRRLVSNTTAAEWALLVPQPPADGG